MLSPCYQRILIKVDTEQKNYHTFEDGTTIRLERGYNNLDGQYTNQVLGTVLGGENIPIGSDILFHFNSIHESNEVFDHHELTNEEIENKIKIYSIPENECFLWKEKDSEDWKTLSGFVTAMRVFEPYKGVLEGVEPKKVKNILYITSGKLKGKVVHTLKACDYCIIFRGTKGIDEFIIRTRHYDYPHEREEITAIDHNLTKKVKNGELLVGYFISDCKKASEYGKVNN